MAKFTTPTRAQLQAAVKDQRMVVALEGLFNAVAVLVSGTVLVLVEGANYSIAVADSNTTFISTAADVKFTLPPTALGLFYRFVSKVPSGGVGVKISPAAADKIMGNGFASLDNKAAINTGATDREGDTITLMGDGVDGWFIVNLTGIWAREV